MPRLQVLQVRHKASGKIFAMKVLNKKGVMDRNEMTHLKAEKSILMKLSSPFLVKLYYSFQTTDKLYFIMDYINGGNSRPTCSAAPHLLPQPMTEPSID
jgi:serine/threonine protein kinase